MTDIMDERKKYINSIIDKIDKYKNEGNIKNVLKKVLNDLGYTEISNNEVILSNLTILYAKENDDFIEPMQQYLDLYNLEYIEKMSNYIYQSLYEFINKNFIYTIEDNKAILNSKSISYYDGLRKQEIKKSPFKIYKYIEDQINERYRYLNLIDYSFEYDLESCNTKVITQKLDLYIRALPTTTRKPCVDAYSKYSIDEYNKEYKMIRDLVTEKEYVFNIEDGMDISNTIKNIIANEDNYNKSTDISVNGEKAMFKMTELVSGDDKHYEMEIPLIYKENIIDYFVGIQYQLGADDEQDEFEEFISALDYSYLTDEMIDNIHNRYNIFKKDLISKTFEFDVANMYPDDLDYMVGKIKIKK